MKATCRLMDGKLCSRRFQTLALYKRGDAETNKKTESHGQTTGREEEARVGLPWGLGNKETGLGNKETLDRILRVGIAITLEYNETVKVETHKGSAEWPGLAGTVQRQPRVKTCLTSHVC